VRLRPAHYDVVTKPISTDYLLQMIEAALTLLATTSRMACGAMA
jgi:hypothetical protein